MNNDQSITAIKHGAIAAFICGTITLVMFTYAIFANNVNWGNHNFMNNIDLWGFVDVAIIFICAIGILLKSRTASVIIFVYFIICKINLFWSYPEEIKANSIMISLSFIYFFVKAIQGTFIYHRSKKDKFK